MRHLACYVTVASALLLAPAQLGLAEVSRPNAVVNQAHTSHKAVGRAETRRAMRDQINSQLVGLVLGGMDDSDLVQAADLIATLDRINLRILPVAGVAAKQNLTDLLLARGIDIAILQTDVLELLKREPPFPGADNFLRYITRLYNQEVHILADGEIRSLEDLTSKKVNFGLSDGGTSFTASALFSALGINLQITNFSQTVALDKLRAGEISALVYVTGKPARLFEAVRPDEGLHFLSIPKDGRLLSSYTEASLTAEDYPELIENGKPIGVLAVGTILAAYNWPSGSDRYRKVARFVGTLFQRFDQLRNPPHHPKWREVDIRSELPGWGRFAPAAQLMRQAEIGNAQGAGVNEVQGASGSTGSGTNMGQSLGELGGVSDPTERRGKAAQTQVEVKPELNTLFSDFTHYVEHEIRAKENAERDPVVLTNLFNEFLEYQKREYARQRRAGNQLYQR